MLNRSTDQKQIRLPLDRNSALFQPKLTSDQYAGLINEFFTPLDLLYTFGPRYCKLFQRDVFDLSGNSGNGTFIEYTSTHFGIALVYTLGVLAAGFANFYREYNKQKIARNNGSYAFIHQQIDKEKAALVTELEAVANEQAKKKHLEELNRYLAEVLEEERETQKKYTTISVEEDGHLVFKLAPQAPAAETSDQAAQTAKNEKSSVKKFSDFMARKVLGPVWDLFTVSSFAYWLLWIGAGVITGILPPGGVAGLSNLFAFGIPLLIGLSYPVFKMWNWHKTPDPKKELNLEQNKAAAQDATRVLRKVLLRQRFAQQRAALCKELGVEESKALADLHLSNNNYSATLNQKLTSLRHNLGLKSVGTFFSDLISTYVGIQYGAWIVTDLLSALSSACASFFKSGLGQAIGGSLLIGLTFVHSIYKGISSYFDRQSTAEATQRLLAINTLAGEAESLEAILKNKRTSIANRKASLSASSQAGIPNDPVEFDQPQFFNNVNRSGANKATTAKKIFTRVFQFANFVTTGAFIARIFFMEGQAILLPFAAAALGPWGTIAAIAIIALTVAIFKTYEYHVRRKEERAKDLLKQHSERVACLKQQVQLAHLVEKVLEKREAVEKTKAAGLSVPDGNVNATATLAPLAPSFGSPTDTVRRSHSRSGAAAVPAGVVPTDGKAKEETNSPAGLGSPPMRPSAVVA